MFLWTLRAIVKSNQVSVGAAFCPSADQAFLDAHYLMAAFHPERAGHSQPLGKPGVPNSVL